MDYFDRTFEKHKNTTNNICKNVGALHDTKMYCTGLFYLHYNYTE